MIRRIRLAARFVLVSACSASLTACPSAAPEGEPDGGGGGTASSGTSGPAASTGGTPTSSGGAPSSSTSTASGEGGQGGEGGAPSTSSQSSGGDGGAGSGGNGGTGGASSSNGGGGAGGEASSSGSGGDASNSASSASGSGGEGGASCEGSEVRCDDGCTDLTSDDENCGECGHDCLGGACAGSECQAVRLYDGTFTAPLVLSEERVWFVDVGTNDAFVMQMPKVPSGQDLPMPFAEASEYANALTLTDSYVVWADFSIDAVTKRALDGQSPQEPLATLDGPTALASFGDDVFAACQYDFTVARIDASNGDVDELTADVEGPTLIVADDAYAYYVDGREFGDGSGDIVRVEHGGANRFVLADSEEDDGSVKFGMPTDLALHAGILYFANPNGVFRLSAGGGLQIPEQLLFASAQQLAVDASGIYSFQSGPEDVIRSDLNGNFIETFVPDAVLVHDMAVDAGALYWTNGIFGEVWKRAK